MRWANEAPDRPFLHQPVDGQLATLTWSQSAAQASRMANALLSLGLKRGDKVAILAKNSAEWVLADFAIAMAGLVSVPIFPTANADTVSYIIGHSDAKAIFVGKLDDPSLASSAIPATIPGIGFPYRDVYCQLHWQELLDNATPMPSPHSPSAEDAMTILYTSGSTGKPKGVVLSFGAYSYASQMTARTVDVRSSDRFLSYLPLSHITERTVTAGPVIYSGAECFFVDSLQTFQKDLARARPTIFISVPRLWVKFQAGVHLRIAPAKLNFLLSIPLLRRVVAKKIRDALGFAHCRHFGSGSAPISVATLRWYFRLGVNIGEGWGMSETGGLSCGNTPFEHRRLGTIGVPIEGTEMKLSEAGEILLRSPGLFTEYYKQPALTSDAFDDDGYFRTGDKAEWIEDLAAFRITGRVKDIFKSAKGKYVTPVPIESALLANPLLEQVCVMGAGLPAPLAVVVLGEAAGNLPRASIASRLTDTLEKTNARLESHERLSNLIVAKDEWTTENGLLTPTLKLKRAELEERYSELISSPFPTHIAWEDS